MAEKKKPDPPNLIPPDQRPERLASLQSQLYAREESATLKKRGRQLSQLGLRKTSLNQTDQADVKERQGVMYKKMTDARRRRRRRIILIVTLLVAFALVVGGTTAAAIWWRTRQTVTTDQIQIAIAAPASHTAGDRITYNITYGNNSFVDWQSVEVAFEAPAGFSFIESSREANTSGRELTFNIGNLPSGAQESVSVTGRLLGAQNASLVAQAQITFTPANFPSGRFDHASLATTVITSAPLDLGIEIPKEARRGERLLATITVSNTSSATIPRSFLKLNAAPGIEFAIEDPQFSPDFSPLQSEWQLPPLGPLETITRQAILFVQGEPGETRSLEFLLDLEDNGERYAQRTASAVIAIADSELHLTQSYNQGESPLPVNAGQIVKGVIEYANTGTIALRDAVVTAKVEGIGLNEAGLKLAAGAFNPTTKTITWTKATMPELGLIEPNTSGQLALEFTVIAADQFPAGTDYGNENIIITAAIDSPDIAVPTGEEKSAVSDRFVLPIATDLLLSVDAFYDDGRLGLTSEGPVPPEVGEQTTYTVRLRVGSSLNDVGEVSIIAVLPDGVRYTGTHYKTTGTLEFNDRTGEISWTMPTLDGGTAQIAPAAELHLQVAITPAANQAGREIPFLNRLEGTAQDLFTDTETTQTVDNLPTTETASPGKGKVQ